MSDDEFKKELEQLKKQGEQKSEAAATTENSSSDDTDEFEGIMTEMMEKKKPEAEEEEVQKVVEEKPKEEKKQHIFALRTRKKKLEVYSVIRPHGMRGYIFLEASARGDAEQAAFNVPYARGILPKEIEYGEIEHMLEQVKKEINIRKNDIAEIISGPFKREKCKVTRIDKAKEEVVVELLEAAVPIPITVKMDAIKVIRRESEEEGPGEPGSGLPDVPPGVESKGTEPNEEEEY